MVVLVALEVLVEALVVLALEAKELQEILRETQAATVAPGQVLKHQIQSAVELPSQLLVELPTQALVEPQSQARVELQGPEAVEMVEVLELQNQVLEEHLLLVPAGHLIQVPVERLFLLLVVHLIRLLVQIPLGEEHQVAARPSGRRYLKLSPACS
jgi:hypothetical protein